MNEFSAHSLAVWRIILFRCALRELCNTYWASMGEDTIVEIVCTLGMHCIVREKEKTPNFSAFCNDWNAEFVYLLSRQKILIYSIQNQASHLQINFQTHCRHTPPAFHLSYSIILIVALTMLLFRTMLASISNLQFEALFNQRNQPSVNTNIFIVNVFSYLYALN